MNKEFSAGGIVFNQQGEVLLTQHSTNKYWSFPKGNIEPPEKEEETATREVKEEGGVEAKILVRLGEQKFYYVHAADKQKVFKTVTFFLMEYLDGDPKKS